MSVSGTSTYYWRVLMLVGGLPGVVLLGLSCESYEGNGRRIRKIILRGMSHTAGGWYFTVSQVAG